MQRFTAEARRLFAMSGPLVAGQLGIMGIGVTDVIVAGHAGTRDLAAVTIGFYIWDLTMLPIFGIVLANSALIGHRYGAGDTDGIRSQFQQCLWVALPLALISALAICGAILVVPSIDLEPAVQRIAIGYLTPTILTAALVPIAVSFRSTVEGLGQMRPVMWLTLCAFLLNIPLDFALVLGLWGLPRLGGAGCGWASLVSFGLLTLAWVAYTRYAPALRRYALWQRFRGPHWPQMGAMLALGLPIGLALLAVGGFFSVIPLAMAPLGTLAVAGHAVAMTFDAVMLTVPLGIGQAMSVRVAHELGAGAPSGARHVCVTGMLLLGLVSLLQAAATVWLRSPIAGLFTADPAVRELGAQLLVFAAAYRLFDSVQIGAEMALRGYQDTRVASAIHIAAYWLFGMPLCYSLGMGSAWNDAHGAQGFWFGMVVAIAVAACCLLWRLAHTSSMRVRAGAWPAVPGEHA
jgi:MATE family multidrug resistance protein